jgi:hypothetical protein
MENGQNRIAGIFETEKNYYVAVKPGLEPGHQSLKLVNFASHVRFLPKSETEVIVCDRKLLAAEPKDQEAEIVKRIIEFADKIGNVSIAPVIKSIDKVKATYLPIPGSDV